MRDGIEERVAQLRRCMSIAHTTAFRLIVSATIKLQICLHRYWMVRVCEERCRTVVHQHNQRVDADRGSNRKPEQVGSIIFMALSYCF